MCGWKMSFFGGACIKVGTARVCWRLPELIILQPLGACAEACAVCCCHPSCAVVLQAIATQPLELPDDVTISPHLRDLFTRLFDKDPDTRITLQVQCSALRHAVRALGCFGLAASHAAAWARGLHLGCCRQKVAHAFGCTSD